jgi:hypothetical protein
MVEDVEKLGIDPEFDLLGDLKPFCHVEIAPEESRAAKLIPAGVAKLAVRRIVSAKTSAGTRVNR